MEVVINYREDKKQYVLYEASTDTIIITESLGEMFMKLNELLYNTGTQMDMFSLDTINYHLDSATFKAIIGTNINLLKRLNTAPSGFQTSTQRFGGGIQPVQSQSQNKNNNFKAAGKTGTFSKSSFKNANKKFGNK
jgi:hypothetical protein